VQKQRALSIRPKFRKFHVANGKVNREIFRMVIPAWVDRAVPFSFGQKFPEIYDREVPQTEIFSNGTVISDQNGPTEKAAHLERWTLFSVPRLVRTVPFSFAPKFPEILVEWKAPKAFYSLGTQHGRRVTKVYKSRQMPFVFRPE